MISVIVRSEKKQNGQKRHFFARFIKRNDDYYRKAAITP